MTVIRFPTAARWDGEMAHRVSWMRRTWWRLFGHKRKAKMTELRMDRIRRYP